MRVLYSKFCEYAAQQANGRRTLVGIFDDIRAPELPVDHPPFFLCLELEFDPSEADRPMDLVSVLVDEDGGEVFRIQTMGQVPRAQFAGPSRLQCVFPIPSLRLERAGDYRLDVTFNGVKIGEERLPVRAVHPDHVPPTS